MRFIKKIVKVGITMLNGDNLRNFMDTHTHTNTHTHTQHTHTQILIWEVEKRLVKGKLLIKGILL